MKYVLLKDVCTINMGQSPDSNSYNSNEDGIPFFQGNADFGEKYPITRTWCCSPTKIAFPEDILISVRAPIGAVNYAKEKCCIGRGLAALTPDTSKAVPEFIFWLLKCKNAELNSKGTGSTFKAIGRKVLEETLVPNISLERQMEYSMVMEKVYECIQVRKKQLVELENLKKARFVELFGDSEHNTNGFPEEKLGNLCNVGSSKRIYQSEQSSRGIPFLRISDLSVLIEKGIDTSNLYISDEKYAELCEKGLVPSVGDILITSRGTLGKCYIIKETDRFYFQDGMISWLSDMSGKITSLYLSYLFSMSGIQKQIINLQAGSTVAYLSITMLKKLDIIIPPLELQERFAAFVAQTDKSKLIHMIQLNHHQGGVNS